MFEFKTLANTSTQAIFNVFNASFADYSIPFKMSMAQLETKMRCENINLNYSVGAFSNGKVLGFILHGTKEKEHKLVAYNGGTGVLPEWRGNSLTTKMYDYIIPKFQLDQFDTVQLEVLSSNVPAIKSYDRIGFEKIRVFNCYSGELKNCAVEPSIQLKDLSITQIGETSQFWDIQPSWQNSLKAMELLGNELALLGAFKEGQLLGYVASNTSNNRIMQLAVYKDHRKQNIASTLLNAFSTEHGSKTSIINIESSNQATNHFFKKCGLEKSVEQNEMILNLK